MWGLPGVIAVASYGLAENGADYPLSPRVSCLLRLLYALMSTLGTLIEVQRKFVSSFISVIR